MDVEFWENVEFGWVFEVVGGGFWSEFEVSGEVLFKKRGRAGWFGGFGWFVRPFFLPENFFGIPILGGLVDVVRAVSPVLIHQRKSDFFEFCIDGPAILCRHFLAGFCDEIAEIRGHPFTFV